MPANATRKADIVIEGKNDLLLISIGLKLEHGRSCQDPIGNLLSEGAIAFPLDVIEYLIEGGILREMAVYLGIIKDVGS